MKLNTPFLSSSLSRILGASLLALTVASPAAHAQATNFPTKSIRMLVPFGPGTTTDTIARMMADKMSNSLGQTIIIENKAGAGGTIGTAQVARSEADGYTILMGTVGTHAINNTLFSNINYDPIVDFEPIAFMGQTPTLLVVKNDSPYQSVKDLATASAKVPGITFASAGNGTSGHLAGELLKEKIGGEVMHIPYKEGSMALSDTMSGQVDFMFYHPSAVLPHIESGKLRAIGSSGASRSIAAPDVPSIAEQTGTDYDLVPWFMLYALSKTPDAVMQKLKDSATQAMNDPELIKGLKNLGLERGGENTHDLNQFAKTEIQKWADIVKNSGAKVN